MLVTTRTFRKRAAMTLAACAVALSVVSAQVYAQSRTQPSRATPPPDNDRPVPNETRPLPEIVARVQATPPYSNMDYIGVESFQVRQRVYVLRFIDGRQVVVVHVDARSGRIIGRGQ